MVVQAVHEGTGERERLQEEEREERAEEGNRASNWDRVEMFMQPWERERLVKPQEEGRERLRELEMAAQQSASDEGGGKKREVERR